MDWYYLQNGKRLGPVDDEEFQGLVNTGVIDGQGLVWHKGMPDWQQYGEVGQEAAPRAKYFKCVECGKLFPAEEMVLYGGSRVCAACKPIFFQRIKEGAKLPDTVIYGGFWIRFVAKFADGVVLAVANGIIQFFASFAMVTPQPGEAPTAVFFLFFFVMMVLRLAVSASYTTFFVGKFAATPGKMICGLKIITSEGGQVSYGRACGRYFAEMLSALILSIGYIMAAFDDEKRTLHDRICDTRVIRK